MARAYNQAQKFGVEMAIPDEVIGFETNPVSHPEHFVLKLADDEHANARAVVIASGARYRSLASPTWIRFESSSVHYWASPFEGKLCAGQEVVLVGAGNSAGQAAVYLASQAAKVWLVGPRCRPGNDHVALSGRPDQRIAKRGSLTGTQIAALEGADGVLQAVRWRHRDSDRDVRRPVRHLFLFIGAAPNTDWLAGSGVALDPKGFVLTGPDAGGDRRQLETTRPGIFAIGDVRSGSVKRVAAAVGEGAQSWPLYTAI